MKEYVVYMHINKTNNKKYVGKTSQSINQRWRSNGSGYKGQVFGRAIAKYGWDNFEHIIVAKGLSEEESNWLEIELIAAWDTMNPNNGYNRTKGGDGQNGATISEETRMKISKSQKGKITSEETKRKISEAKRGAKNPTSKAVRCIETGQVYGSAREASRALGKDKSAVTNSIRNHYKCGGYHWEYVS